MHEAEHVADGVDGAHLLLHGAVVAEEAHAVGLAEIEHDGVAVALELRVEVLAVGRASGNVFGKPGYLLVTGVLPGIGAPPVLIEPLLHDLHLLPHGFLGIGLHARVDGGVDAQSVGIEVELLCQEGDSTTVDITRAGTHHQTLQRSKTHRGIYALTVDDSCDRTAITDMTGDNALADRTDT